MGEPVKAHRRTRRAEKAQATHDRIVYAATRLFLESGYVQTTLEAIAAGADVAVETVYARFRNKTTLMIAVKDAAVAEGGQVPLDRRPELVALAAEIDPRQQLQMAAALSRGMLQRISPVYGVLRDAAGADVLLRDHLAAEIDRRRNFQRKVVEHLASHTSLRDGLSTDEAADTYSALANPDIYLLLTNHHGWSAGQYEGWLVESLRRLLLPADSPGGARHLGDKP